jgi:hypothetical protein
MIDHVHGGGGQRLHLTVGGLRSDLNEFVTWISQPLLKVGDKIAVKILEAEKVDPP